MNDLHYLFSPSSIAVIGASGDKNKLGGRPVHFLKEFGYQGKIYPVNPRATEVQGLLSFSTITDIPDDVELAVIVIPAVGVEAALQTCIEKGVKVVQILSSGFAETNDAGRAMQGRILAMVKKAGIRITGPNALGSISPANGVYATFSSSMAASGLRLKPGNIAIATQSGAFGSCAYVMATRRDIGLSRVIATGNEADIDVAECISYLVDDPETSVICAAIEGCGNGDKLRQALRKAAEARKPVVMMKVGSTEQGAAAAATHTGALAGNDAIFDAVFSECGAWRAHSIEEMIDLAYLFSLGNIPPENNALGILTVSGGIGILMADKAIEMGLAVPQLSTTTLDQVMSVCPFATGNNPLDTTAQIASDRVAVVKIGRAIFDGDGFGAMVFYLAHNALSSSVFAQSQQALIDFKAEYPNKTVVCVMPSNSSVRQALEAAGIAVYEDPSRAVAAIAAAAGINQRWGYLEDVPVVNGYASALPEQLDEATAKLYLASAGIPVLDEKVCTSLDEAVQAAEAMGYPLVAKLLSPDILHKTEVGGVVLNLSSKNSVMEAYDNIVGRARSAHPKANIIGILLAPMIDDGVETILGVHDDPIFGPMVMFGMGGVTVEIFKDVAFSSIPITQKGAERLINSVKGSVLLNGWRGATEVDKQALVDAICKLSELVIRSPQIKEVDINPFVVRQKGAFALDALIVPKGP